MKVERLDEFLKNIRNQKKMENRVSLSNYFGFDQASDGGIFDVISSSAPVDMTQSVNLLEDSNTENIFSETPAMPSVQNALTTPATVPSGVLPDPATFFDTITPDLQIGPTHPAPKIMSDYLAQSMEGLSVKDQQPSTAIDRRRDAWIPSDEAKKILTKAQSAPAGSFFPEREVLTTPGIILEEELTDGLHSVASRLLGSAEVSPLARPGHVTRDDTGLVVLLRAGHLRPALALTTALISAAGQGAVSLGRPSRHTPRLLQLWLTRFAIMVRLRLREPLVKEAEAFGNLGQPDMYYQFYPGAYGDRTGSMAPFSLRVLLAELPLHTGDPATALDNIYALLATVRKMLCNLRSGLTEDGGSQLDERERTESIRLWSGRETRVLHSLINCAVALKEYRLAIETARRLASEASSDTQARALHSAICRLCVRVGHVRGAERHLAMASELRERICPTPDAREYMDRALLATAQARYQEACAHLARAAEQNPTDVTVANNMAVCLLYSGRLKEAIAILQKAIASDPERALCESLILNLCTLYELESSKTREKKLELLRTMCKYKKDTLPDIECLKLG